MDRSIRENCANSIKLSLASFLENHQDEIVADWANRIQRISGAPYQKFSYDDIAKWTAQGLDGMIQYFATGSNQALDKYLTEIALSRLVDGFSIYEVTEALLLAKEAIYPILISSYHEKLPDLTQVISQLNICSRYMIRSFGYLFSEATHYRLLDETNRRLTESESIKRTMSALLQKLTLDEVLEIVCSEAKQLTNATGSSVLLLEGEWLQVTFSVGKPLPELERIPADGSLAGLVIQKGQPFLLNTPIHQVQAYHWNPDLQSLLVIPLFLEGTSIGVIDVVNKPGGFQNDDIRILNLFADQAAIAIETTRLHQQAEQLAIIRERQRLARDLHDSVTQTMYSLSLFANATQKALQGNRVERALENLDEVQKLVREAMLDMRLLIFELHPPLLQKEGLATALRTRLESVEARSGIQTEYQVFNERRLSLETETELYRIAQEALTNVVKHSKANRVNVILHYSEDKIKLEVQDNGIGFDSSQANTGGGLGLRGMQERVRRMNGRLDIESKPNTGTKLEVVLQI